MGLFTFLFRRRRRRRLDEDGTSGAKNGDTKRSRRRWATSGSPKSGGAKSNTRTSNNNNRNQTESPTHEPTESQHNTLNTTTGSPLPTLQQQRRRGPDLSDGGTAPPTIRPNRSGGPVDTDHVSSSDDDDVAAAAVTSPPTLSSKPVFHLADDTTDNEDDDETDDGDCSTFNISTDAEDIEYESMRRRLGVLSKTGNVTPMNDAASLATSQEDGSVFPNLQSEDEGTLGTSTVTKEAAAHSILQLNPATGASLVPDAPFTAAFPNTTTTTSTTPQSETTFGTSVANAAPAFVAAVQQQQPKVEKQQQPQQQQQQQPAKTPRKLQASVKDSPDRRRPKFGTTSNTNSSSNFMDTVYGSNNKTSSSKEASTPTEFDPFFAEKEPAGFVDFADFNAFAPTTTSVPKKSKEEPVSSSRSVTRSSSASVTNETSLEELLATAKSKKQSKRQTSISSAPAMTAAYLRQQHNLQRKKHESAGVTDIIHSLEAANASRRHYRSHSDAASRTSTRSGKSSRRRRAATSSRHSSSHRYHSDSDDDDHHNNHHHHTNDQENWLFDEVTGALGPKGIAADLESLSGRSGNSRRRRRHKSGNDSVDSSRHSRDSRRSRYSHRSYMSQMSEQSRSVANDLLRLERQLAMVGESGTSVRSVKSRRSASTRSRWTVTAPAGKLGIILANKADAKGTVVSGVRTSSSLADTIAPGDRIVAIDGEDVSLMTVSEITTIMARKAEYERTLTVLTTRTRATE